jgi:hypothetical protein
MGEYIYNKGGLIKEPDEDLLPAVYKKDNGDL